MKRLITSVSLCAALLAGCTGTPKGIEPVSNFNAENFYGTWHEVARLDNSFEEGLSLVTASYQPLPDNQILVTNRGFNMAEGKWEQDTAKGEFAKDPQTGHLNISFLWPFEASYVVFYLEDDYSVALVTSHNKDYLWILSKNRQLPESEIQRYVSIAQEAGFDTSKLIFDKDNQNLLEGVQALYKYEEDADRVTPLSEEEYTDAELHIMPAQHAAKIN